MKNDILKGSFFVAIGAASYGLLATFVKLAYKQDFTLAEVCTAQFVWGLFGLLILNLIIKINPKQKKAQTASNKIKLLIAGISLGLTSTFYYYSVKYIPVSLAIVLLMQTVWMGVVLEMMIDKKMPSARKFIAVILILIGTVLATNLIENEAEIHWVGIGWGLLAALSYTLSVFATNKIALEMHPFRKTIWMLIGGFITVLIISSPSLMERFDLSIFWGWGFLLALFGTILPPIMFSVGMPKITLGLGAILSAIEIPVSVMMAYFILKEPIGIYQWFGIALIIFTVIWMNSRDKNAI